MKLLIFFALAAFTCLPGCYHGETSSKYRPREYQIEINNDSILVYDGERFVGGCEWGGGKIDSIFLKDNQ